MSLKLAKRELRRSIKKVLAEIPAESVAKQTRTAVQLLTALPEYERARRISIYLSMPGEISTVAVLDDAFKRGKRVFIPYINMERSPSVMEMLALESRKDFDSLQPDKWGIPSIAESSVSSRENCLGEHGSEKAEQVGVEQGKGGLDLIVMPGLAFDTGLHRLGHGKGYYDRFLRQLYDTAMEKGQAMPFLVGLALNEQISDNVPVDVKDWPLDGLIIGDGRLLRSPGSQPAD